MTTVAAYNFNYASEGATVYDDVGLPTSPRNGTVTGTVALSVGPISAKKRTFNGSGANRIVVPHHADFTLLTDWSLEAWVNLAVTPAATYTIVAKGDVASEGAVLLGVNASGYPYATVSKDGSNYIVATATAFGSIGTTLRYIVATFDYSRQELRIYVDGLVIAAGVETGSYSGTDNTKDVKLGCNDANSNAWNGALHAVRWSNACKTAGDIYNTYHGVNVRAVLPWA